MRIRGNPIDINGLMTTNSCGVGAKRILRAKNTPYKGRFAKGDLAIRTTVGPLAAHDLVTLNSTGGVAGIDHQPGVLDDLAVIVVGMVGHDHHAVILG